MAMGHFTEVHVSNHSTLMKVMCHLYCSDTITYNGSDLSVKIPSRV